MSKFSERFRQLKEEKQGMTLKELSAQLDISVPNLSYYMKGREPNYDTLIKISDYFNVTVDWLVGRTDARNSAQSSIISEIEMQLQLDSNDKLSGKNRELFSYNVHNLYSAMIDMYALFLFTFPEPVILNLLHAPLWDFILFFAMVCFPPVIILF